MAVNLKQVAATLRAQADLLDPPATTTPPVTGGGTTTPPVTTPPVINPSAFTGRTAPSDINSFWKLKVEDAFTTLAAEGQFLSTYKTWSAYPTNYLTTNGQSNGAQKGDHYGVNNLSVADRDGVRALICRMIPKALSSDGHNIGAAPFPLWDNGLGKARSRSMRVEMRVRIPNQVPGWHPANLMWFDDESWPGGGENDFWEQSTPGTIGAFFHNAGATSGGDQVHFESGISPADWHVITAEFISGTSYKMFVDGRQIGSTITSRLPKGIARLVLQNEPDGAPTQAMEIQYDWITVHTE